MNLFAVVVPLILLHLPAGDGALKELTWNNDRQAFLHFCKNGNTYGYAPLGETCVPGRIGPIIRMTAGQSYILHLINDSDEDTNIHTHGLHIAGHGNTDDVTRVASPGYCLKYYYDIPNDHSSGTYWYHAHKHGATDAQVSGGAFGPLIIDSAIESRPSSVNAMVQREHILFFSSTSELGDQVNGLSLGSESITLGTDTWELVRLANNEPRGSESTFTFDTSNCQAVVVARDGVWLSSVDPANVNTGGSLIVTIGGASRADVALMCSSNSGIYYNARNLRGTPDVIVQVDPGMSSQDSSPFDGGSVWKPRASVSSSHYLADLRGLPASKAFPNIAMSGAQINGASWDPSKPLFEIPYDEVFEFEISGSGAHPFHLHLNHMQVVTPGGCGGYLEEGEYYDTISGSTCKVRIATRDLAGRQVFHCHVLSHEDNGAMGWANIVGGPIIDDTDRDPVPSNQCCFETECVIDPTYECGFVSGVNNCGTTCSLDLGGCTGTNTCNTQTFICEADGGDDSGGGGDVCLDLGADCDPRNDACCTSTVCDGKGRKGTCVEKNLRQ